MTAIYTRPRGLFVPSFGERKALIQIAFACNQRDRFHSYTSGCQVRQIALRSAGEE